ncbi:MAG: hypothetical protein L6Q37_00745 [Bdellovibrionaceae bacterium]|nr:hypothetical protein [Pseudobdellovibrionaceae bacterium]NUM57526.1 hypothetical protein [Pseudobdellovibrionaceae bacterium]
MKQIVCIAFCLLLIGVEVVKADDLTSLSLFKENLNKRVENFISYLSQDSEITQAVKHVEELNQEWKEKLKQFKEKFPVKGPAEEEVLLSFVYSFSPLFELAENLPKEMTDLKIRCEKLKNQILLEDENHTLKIKKPSFEAQKAIESLDSFCSKKH